jgi:hypothetical protein
MHYSGSSRTLARRRIRCGFGAKGRDLIRMSEFSHPTPSGCDPTCQTETPVKVTILPSIGMPGAEYSNIRRLQVSLYELDAVEFASLGGPVFLLSRAGLLIRGWSCKRRRHSGGLQCHSFGVHKMAGAMGWPFL